jgi:hypothetical protein
MRLTQSKLYTTYISKLYCDRDHVTAEENNDVAEGINHDAIITQRSRGPQVWRVYTRRGKKDNTQ